MAKEESKKDIEVDAKEVNASEEKKETKAKKSKSKEKDIKVRILCSNAAGKYKLPYTKGRITTLPAKQAEEMIENGDATADLKKHQAK